MTHHPNTPASRTEQAAPSVASGASETMDLAHELYAMAQGPQPVEDAVQAIAQRLSSDPTTSVLEALRWTAAALQAVIDSRGESGSISMIVSGEKKSLEEVLDMADAALTAPGAAQRGARGYLGSTPDGGIDDHDEDYSDEDTPVVESGPTDEQILETWAPYSVWGFTKDERVTRAREILALAAPGAAIAAREQEALVDALMLACEKFWWNDGPVGKTRDEMHEARAKVLAALASRQKAPAASGLLNFSLRPEDCIVLHAAGPYPLYRCMGCNTTDYGAERMVHGTGCRVEAALKGNTAPTAARSPATVAQPVEWPDDVELEAWRSTADDLLRSLPELRGTEIRSAAHLLQNAYLFASKAKAAQPCPSQGCGGDGGYRNVALASKTAQVDVRAILEGQGVYLSTPTIDSIVRASLSGLEHVGKESE